MNTTEDLSTVNENNNGNGRMHWSLGRVLRKLEHKLRAIFGLPATTLKESLEEVIEEHDAVGADIPVEEKELLRNVLAFGELRVENVMVPRADIVLVDENVTLDELKATILEKAHTRVPVYRDNPDNIIGFIHTKDLVSVLCDDISFDIAKVLRQALFVPPSMKISDLLLHMRAARVHMAIVIDEYGGTSGLVTMEDVMEELVGEIEDEHDLSENQPDLVEVSKGVFDANARLEVSVLEQKLGEKLANENHEEDFDTLGGMIFAMLGRIPSAGEVVTHPNGHEFEIVDADPRRVKRIIIRQRKVQVESE